MDILDILMGYGPILFSGAVIGSIVSYFGPEIIKAMRTNFVHRRVMDLYDGFKKNPAQVEQNQPELANFFKQKAWEKCDCPNCEWLSKKVKKSEKSQNKQENKDKKKLQDNSSSKDKAKFRPKLKDTLRDNLQEHAKNKQQNNSQAKT